MLLTEETGTPDEVLPVQALKDHLRIGTGFSDDGMQDGLIVAQLRAAIAMIEGRTGKALLARRFRLSLDRLQSGRSGQALPVAPVSSIISVHLFSGPEAQESTVDPGRYRLVQDMARPRIVGGLGGLPQLFEGDRIDIVFDAGFGSTWGAVPADLGQAVLLLAAEYYETRHEGSLTRTALPMSVHALIERWRTVRLLAGGGS